MSRWRKTVAARSLGRDLRVLTVPPRRSVLPMTWPCCSPPPASDHRHDVGPVIAAARPASSPGSGRTRPSSGRASSRAGRALPGRRPGRRGPGRCVGRIGVRPFSMPPQADVVAVVVEVAPGAADQDEGRRPLRPAAARAGPSRRRCRGRRRRAAVGFSRRGRTPAATLPRDDHVERHAARSDPMRPS